MRKLIVTNIMSLDGYYEGPGKNVMPLFEYLREDYPGDERFDLYNAERLRAADTLLLGRSSFEGFKNYWPQVADNADARPVEREISRLDNAIDKVVVSDTLTEAELAPWTNTRILRRSEAHEQVAALKEQPGGEILIFGSRELWNDLLAHGLVDELHLLVSPVVLGAGTPLFDGALPGSLRLLEARSWEGSGLALLRYDAVRKGNSIQ